jgi:uncharacterized protein YxeA
MNKILILTLVAMVVVVTMADKKYATHQSHGKVQGKYNHEYHKEKSYNNRNRGSSQNEYYVDRSYGYDKYDKDGHRDNQYYDGNDNHNNHGSYYGNQLRGDRRHYGRY